MTVSLFDWEPTPVVRSYLRPRGDKRRRCKVYVRNEHFNGVLRNNARARTGDHDTSIDAAESIDDGDIYEVKRVVDWLLLAGNGVIMTEVREYMLYELGKNNVRAESIRRRFSDLCP